MNKYQRTEDKAVKELINWKTGKRESFPESEIKSHFNLFNEALKPKEHKNIAAQTIAIKCLSMLSKKDIQDIDQKLKELIQGG